MGGVFNDFKEISIMKNTVSVFGLFFSVLILLSCSFNPDETGAPSGVTGGTPGAVQVTPGKPDDSGAYKMMEAPVPQGGLIFPVGSGDEDTAAVDTAFSLGETEVSFGLWQEVAFWACFEKEGEQYNALYFLEHPYLTDEHEDYPINGISYLQALVWCNAYTEWHNDTYGTDYTAVYTDAAGNPIREAFPAFGPEYVLDFAVLDLYLSTYPTMQDYLENSKTAGNGFRLPTSSEWELAARWRGDDDTNTVTETINGVDFARQAIHFTKGNSASGAVNDSSDESHKYAVFGYNSSDGKVPSVSKTKLPNALHIYDMSGNLKEYTYDVQYRSIRGYAYPFAAARGGCFVDQSSFIVSGDVTLVDAANYNYYYGFRMARDK
jgi:formylglycine-generating enzyme required for sulfatase activity